MFFPGYLQLCGCIHNTYMKARAKGGGGGEGVCVRACVRACVKETVSTVFAQAIKEDRNPNLAEKIVLKKKKV